MTLLQIGGLFCVVLTLASSEDNKWVWKDNGRSSRGSDRASPRYETYEKDDIDYPGGGGAFGGLGGVGPGFDYNRPGRPGGRPYPRPPGVIGGGDYGGGSYRPGLNGPYPEDVYPGGPGFQGGPGFGPGGPGGLGGGPGGFGGGPGGLGGGPGGFGGGPGGLGGGPGGFDGGPGFGGGGPGGDPGFIGGPGIGGRPPFKKFDTCTCSERFNCKSPGISYGHCDAGKSYCCFNKHGGIDVEPAPSRPIHSPENGILVGPGHGSGGYGKPGYAGRPGLGRPGLGRPIYPEDQGILVGPGGPTGIIGRPGGYGRPGNGVLAGPGGPYDRPYGRPGLSAYGRSAGAADAKKDGRA